MQKTITLLSLTLGLLLFTLIILPAPAAALQPASPLAAGRVGEPVQAQPVVHAIMFWMDGCPHCHEVLDNVLPPLQQKYGPQLDILLVEVVGLDDVNRLYDIAATYGFSRDQVGVPLIIIGEDVLIGSEQIPAELPGLIEGYLAQGGVNLPSIPNLSEFLAQTRLAPLSAPGSQQEGIISGFTLAILVMLGMLAALLYSMIAFWQGKSFRLPAWADWLIPALILAGIGVAGYLSYVETQAVEAVCGPVGDCNAVQASPYAKMFGVLPVGVLGLLGYFALLAAWLARRFVPALEKLASIGFFGMAFFAVLFSLYLTFLEPFVIKAVCMWCLSSSVIVTLLLLLGTQPAISYLRTRTRKRVSKRMARA